MGGDDGGGAPEISFSVEPSSSLNSPAPEKKGCFFLVRVCLHAVLRWVSSCHDGGRDGLIEQSNAERFCFVERAKGSEEPGLKGRDEGRRCVT